MPSFEPTVQQQEIIDAFTDGDDLIIEAGAGCGKTATLRLLAEEDPRARGLFLAFNRAVADDAEHKLNETGTLARNTHRLAYAWANGDRVASQIMPKLNSGARVRPSDYIAPFKIKPLSHGKGLEKTSVSAFKLVQMSQRVLESFMRSGDAQITGKHFTLSMPVTDKKFVADIRDECVRIAKDMWADLLSPSGSVRMTHDVYLKLWSLACPVLPYDFILLDEAQDTNPATKVVFDAQDTQKICVGDSSQQLFRWTGAVNVMGDFAGRRLKLTQSWRFGTAIEQAANIFLSELDAPIRLQGNPRLDSQAGNGLPFDPTKSAATLTITNASAIAETLEALRLNKTVHLVGGSASMVTLVQDIQNLRQGKQARSAELLGFNSYEDVKKYIDESGDEARDISNIVSMCEKHGAHNILNALSKCVSDEDRAQVVISTVHKVKGREWDQVRLSSDFAPRKTKKGDNHPDNRETLMLKYVAVTRAKHVLDYGPLDMSGIRYRPVREHAPAVPSAESPEAPDAQVTLDADLAELLSDAVPGVSLDDAVDTAVRYFLDRDTDDQ